MYTEIYIFKDFMAFCLKRMVYRGASRIKVGNLMKRILIINASTCSILVLYHHRNIFVLVPLDLLNEILSLYLCGTKKNSCSTYFFSGLLLLPPLMDTVWLFW